MEYCEGGNLKSYMKEKSYFLSESEALTVFKQIC